MIEHERRALSALRFDSAHAPDDVWRNSRFHVDELHQKVVESVFDDVNLARSSADSNPLGVIIQGRTGSGKTHMLGMVRERTQRDGGYFFLVSLLNGKTFWESASLCVVEGLLRESHGWPTQLKAFLRRLTSMIGLSSALRDAIAGDAVLTPADLDQFIGSLRRFNRPVGQETQDTLRALVLHGSTDMKAQDVGYAYLSSLDGADSPERAIWGIGSAARSPQLIVRDISRLFALTDPMVIAIDQIDTLFAQSTGSVLHADDVLDSEGRLLVGRIADGLMTLRDITRRTLITVACLPDTWEIIKANAAGPMVDRFRHASAFLGGIPSQGIGEAIVAKRFAAFYGDVGFTPPYATWPVLPAAFADAPDLTPRHLLQRVERHINSCLRDGQVRELVSLVTTAPLSNGSKRRAPTNDGLSAVEDRFQQLVAQADVSAAFDHQTEDQTMPALLAAGLAAWAQEQGNEGKVFKHDPPPNAKPALHARLRLTLNEATEDEMHWGFRAIAHDNATAVLNRIQNACTMAGLESGVSKRKLFLLRNTNWPNGPRTRETVDAFKAAGGVVTGVVESDLKVFSALRQLLAERDENLAGWLLERRPASSTQLLGEILADVTTPVTTADMVAAELPTDLAEPQPARRPDIPTQRSSVDPISQLTGPSIQLGQRIGSGEPLLLDLESLRKHTAIFAGSGSGKTVLIRRLVEECALQGVSAIVLDPNNDLSRLGDGWPDTPGGWLPGDPAKAREYLDNTDVVIWTPRIDSGRPVTFQPLPNLSVIRHDPDEYRAAVDIAVAALAPRAKVDGNTRKAQLGQAVLRDALHFFARQGDGKNLNHYISILAALPDGVSGLGQGEKIAAEMADSLTAATVNDPLFGGDGIPMDPGLLLTPPSGKRARVSVISFIGLNTEEARQGFVNQLQMALFAWIKRHPAGDRPLGGLFVMDEAQTLAPSTGNTACTASTLALVSQARKYGLGLVFATQAPKGLHNYIPGNAATQFFGLLNAPVQIGAAKEMAQAKGGTLPNIGLLKSGQFYAAREGVAFQKVQTPMCLTHHPKAPLAPEEVIERARSTSIDLVG